MNKFLIEDNKLFLKSKRHKVTVSNNVTPEELTALALDLTMTALAFRRTIVNDLDYIWCNELERKVIFFLSQGMTRKQIALRCGVHPDSISRCIGRLKAKLHEVWNKQVVPKKPKQSQKYQKVRVTTLPFSQLVDLDDDEEEMMFDPGDNGLAQAEVYRKLEVDTAIENSDTYLMLVEKKQKALAKLLAQGLSREECAKRLGLKSTQAIHQMIGRMRKQIRKCRSMSSQPKN